MRAAGSPGEVAGLRPALRVVVAPVLLALAFGASGAWLDVLSLPGAVLLACPSRIGVLASGAVGFVLALRAGWPGSPEPRVPRFVRAALDLLEELAPLAVIGHLLATLRPLPWPWLVLGGVVAGRGALLSATRSGFAGTPHGRWLRAAVLGSCWPAAAGVRPFGPGWGPLPATVEAAIVSAPALATGLLVLPLAFWWWKGPEVRPRPGLSLWPWRLAGLLLAGLGTSFQGRPEWGALALVLGWLSPHAVALLPGLRGSNLPFLGLLVACALPAAVPARFDCKEVPENKPVVRLGDGVGIRSVAALPGNLALPVVLDEGGSRLRRLSPSGDVAASAMLNPPGDRLHSPAREGGALAVTRSTDRSIEARFLDPYSLDVRSTTVVEARCARWGEPRMQADGEALWWPCPEDGLLWVVRRDGVPTPPWAAGRGLLQAEPLDGTLLAVRGGPGAEARLLPPAPAAVERVLLGPFATGVEALPGRWAVARGALGQVDLRGPGTIVVGVPGFEPPPPGPAGTWAGTLGRRVEVSRVPHAADRIGLSLSQRALWVWAPNDARLTLVDADVSWQRQSVHLGAAPRSVAVDSVSGTLIAANICGLFSVTVPRIDPWAEAGELPTPTPIPAETSPPEGSEGTATPALPPHDSPASSSGTLTPPATDR